MQSSNHSNRYSVYIAVFISASPQLGPQYRWKYVLSVASQLLFNMTSKFTKATQEKKNIAATSGGKKHLSVPEDMEFLNSTEAVRM